VRKVTFFPLFFNTGFEEGKKIESNVKKKRKKKIERTLRACLVWVSLTQGHNTQKTRFEFCFVVHDLRNVSMFKRHKSSP